MAAKMGTVAAAICALALEDDSAAGTTIDFLMLEKAAALTRRGCQIDRWSSKSGRTLIELLKIECFKEKAMRYKIEIE